MPGSKTDRMLYWSVSRASHKKRLIKCTRGNCTRDDKTKCCFPHHKTTRLTLFNVKWANKTKLCSQSSKRPNTTKKPKTKSSRSRSPLPWPWRKSTPAKYLSKPRTKRSSGKDFKDWLMSILSGSSSLNIKTILTCSWSRRLNRPSLGKIRTLESRKESMKMIWVKLSNSKRTMPMYSLYPGSMCKKFWSRSSNSPPRWLIRKLSSKKPKKF